MHKDYKDCSNSQVHKKSSHYLITSKAPMYNYLHYEEPADASRLIS